MRKRYQLINFGNHYLDWENVAALTLDEYPWYKEGQKESTVVKMAIHKNSLFIKALHEDYSISSHCITYNGSVHKDSCFEFFFAPQPDKPDWYLNLEINCCKTIYFGYGTKVVDKRFELDKSFGDQIKIESSIETATKELSPTDSSWNLTLEIPLKLIEEITGKPLSKTLWRGNIYRCGGDVNPQYAAWSPITYPSPNFHLPEFFGEILLQEKSQGGCLI